MRPIDRGPPPREYAEYGDAIGDLEERLGRYCSYCERRLPVSLAVEHMAPKSVHRCRERDWNNFLLGCVNCNSVKKERDIADDDVLWLDRHNTMLAIAYSRGGFIVAADGLDNDLNRRANSLIELVGLNRHGAEGWPRPSKRDQRWKDREEIWAEATRCRFTFESLGETPEALELVVSVAKAYGFFSVWMTVFEGHSDARRALIQEFPGTAPSCFNAAGELVRRPFSDL